MFRKLLTREQAEHVRKYARTNAIGIIPTVVELKFASEGQRLVRVNRGHCAEDYEPTSEDVAALQAAEDNGRLALDGRRLRCGTGCLHCRQTGYAGRDGVFQIMPITERLRYLVAQQAPRRRYSMPRAPKGCARSSRRRRESSDGHHDGIGDAARHRAVER